MNSYSQLKESTGFNFAAFLAGKTPASMDIKTVNTMVSITVEGLTSINDIGPLAPSTCITL